MEYKQRTCKDCKFLAKDLSNNGWLCSNDDPTNDFTFNTVILDGDYDHSWQKIHYLDGASCMYFEPDENGDNLNKKPSY